MNHAQLAHTKSIPPKYNAHGNLNIVQKKKTKEGNRYPKLHYIL